MIRIQSIDVEEFRGIRRLHIDLEKKNFGICGPNGTGKSGIVDAVEYALTGNITRLSGSGTGDISLKEHAPHVDSRGKPEKSRVKLSVFSPALKKSFVIERTIAATSSPTITPSEPQIMQIVEQLALHPEFALSRREIVKYIITPAGQRSKDVQTLLRLDQIEVVRMSLQKVANARKKEATGSDTEDKRTRADFLVHLGIPTFTKAELLKAVNVRRAILQVEPITEFTVDSSLKAGINVAEKKPGSPPTISRDAAIKSVGAYEQHIATAKNTDISTRRSQALAFVRKLKEDPATLRSFRQQVLVTQGLELLGDDACPLCDTAWDIASLRKHLEEKRSAAAGVKTLLGQLEVQIDPIIGAYDEIIRATQAVELVARASKPTIDISVLKSHSEAFKRGKVALSRVCHDPAGIDDAIIALTDAHWEMPAAAGVAVKALMEFAASLPEPSKEEAARDFLILAQEKYDKCRVTGARKDSASKESALAEKVYKSYGASSTAVLEGIYDSVESDFTDYYRFINQDDEEKFVGQLSTPSPAKLALNVDFYGRGKFPPGAYHSEGHQDGMGLCLYLALMKHTLGDGFTFAVLDDVLMSVDSGHRREVCSLLKSKFPKTQFVLTTHDPVWLQFMRTEQLVEDTLSFAGWSVDSGPQVWSEGDIWPQLEALLAKNDVAGAAAKLRRYLEYMGTILAGNLRASVEYHSGGQYDLGDLMPPAFTAFKKLLDLAKESAKSWGQSTAEIEALQSIFNTKVARTNAEQWAINKAVHFNVWATMQAKEFSEVVSAFKDALSSMQCSKAICGEFLRVSPRKGQRESLSCGCGAINFNLKKK